jgi:hypothetical protein
MRSATQILLLQVPPSCHISGFWCRSIKSREEKRSSRRIEKRNIPNCCRDAEEVALAEVGRIMAETVTWSKVNCMGIEVYSIRHLYALAFRKVVRRRRRN